MSRRQHPLSVRTIDLDHEQFMILEGSAGTRLKVLYGGMWLTTDGDAEDRFPGSGDEVAVMAHRQSLLQATGRRRVELIEPIRPQALRRAFEALRRWLQPAVDPQRG